MMPRVTRHTRDDVGRLDGAAQDKNNANAAGGSKHVALKRKAATAAGNAGKKRAALGEITNVS